MTRHKSNFGVIIVIVLVVIACVAIFKMSRQGALDSVVRTISPTTNIGRGQVVTVTYTYSGTEKQWAVDETLPANWGVVGLYNGNSAIAFGSFGTTQNKGYRFTSDNTTAGKVVTVQITSPTTGTGGTITFAQGMWWSVGFTTMQQLPTATVTMLGCATFLKYDQTANAGNANCIIESNEWLAFRAKWLSGTEANTELISHGNAYYSGGSYI